MSISVLLTIEAVSAPGLTQLPADKIKVACVGNSVTYGYGLADRENYSYPSRLSHLLGEGYEVRNFGRNGATLLSKGHNPYARSEEYLKVLEYKPDMVIIDLGLNDTDPRNWPNYSDDFIPDYQNLTASFIAETGKPPTIFICMMTPVFPGHSRFKSGTRDWFLQIQEKIRQVAINTGANLVDLHTPLYRRPDLFFDFLHPNEEGAAIIAETLYSAITGDYGGFRLASVFGEHMVFQQKKPVVVYGTSDKNDIIDIALDKQSRRIIVSKDGLWKAVFHPLPPGGPYPMMIKVNDTLQVNWKDILSGEVWLCSGQSNMAFELKYAKNGLAASINANAPEMRLLPYNGFAQTNDVEFDKTSLDRINRLDYFEGKWQTVTRESAADFSAIGYFFGEELHKKLKVPVGLIQVAVGGAPIESFIDRRTIECNPVLVDQFLNRERNDFIFEWVRQRITKNISINNVRSQRHPYDPAYIYESGIQPLINFPLRGVLWYQGESNAHNAALYKISFRDFISSWRNVWDDPEMPFYIAQLSSIDRPAWPQFRDIQRQLVNETSHSGLVITSDLGDSLNVHPVQKQQVGERFAYQALAKVYGKRVTADGPVPVRLVKKTEKVEILFRSARQLTTSDQKKIREIEVAGSDGIFKNAEASLKRKKVIIAMPGKEVSAVRYGWEPFSQGNLANRASIPSSTFFIK